MSFEHLTPIELCKAIDKGMGYILPESLIVLMRVYERTFQIVKLYRDKLAVPTKHAKGRLLDLLNAMENERYG